MQPVLTEYVLLARAVNVDGYKNPITYDEEQTSLYGHWLCSECKWYSEVSLDPLHRDNCRLRHDPPEGNPRFIYVLGPNDGGFINPFTPQTIEKVKAAAFAHMKKIEVPPPKA